MYVVNRGQGTGLFVNNHGSNFEITSLPPSSIMYKLQSNHIYTQSPGCSLREALIVVICNVLARAYALTFSAQERQG